MFRGNLTDAPGMLLDGVSYIDLDEKACPYLSPQEHVNLAFQIAIDFALNNGQYCDDYYFNGAAKGCLVGAETLNLNQKHKVNLDVDEFASLTMIIKNIMFQKPDKFLHFMDHLVRAIYGTTILTDYLEPQASKRTE